MVVHRDPDCSHREVRPRHSSAAACSLPQLAAATSVFSSVCNNTHTVHRNPQRGTTESEGRRRRRRRQPRQLPPAAAAACTDGYKPQAPAATFTSHALPHMYPHMQPHYSSQTADLQLHGLTDEELACRDADRLAEEELAARYRAAAADAGTLAKALLSTPEEGEEDVATWLQRRWAELGVRCGGGGSRSLPSTAPAPQSSS